MMIPGMWSSRRRFWASWYSDRSGGCNGNRGAGMHWIRDDKREAIYHRDGDRCVYCGEGRASCMLTLDHLEPRDHGGSNDAQNLVTACVGCNSARRLLSLDEWARALCTLHGVSDGRRRVAAAVRRAASVAIDRIEGKRRVAARKAPAAGRSAA